VSTIFNVRTMRLPNISRRTLVAAGVAVVLLTSATLAGYHLYRQLTTTTIVAYFPQALALYPGDAVQILDVSVGSIDRIEPDGDKMKVTLHYNSKYKIPTTANASILNPSLVASRTIELSPAYTGGPVMTTNGVIPIERTQVPVEWDDLRDSIDRLVTGLGPTPEQPKGPFGDVLEAAADGFAGKGKQINDTFTSLSAALSALNEGRGDFFGVIKSLALFVNALHQSDKQFTELNDNLAVFTDSFTNTDHELADTVRQLNGLLESTRSFVTTNRQALTADIDNLAEVTNAILQPDALNGLETALHILPNAGANVVNISSPVNGGIIGIPTVTNFANPMQFICSAIQAGSRLGYQDSAELCAQYLAPVLDAIKFNFPPFGVNQVSTALTLPKMVTYSEPRLQPPPGYKDTTVPGIFSRDTLFSHGNHEPGWAVAPGMQGVDVQPFTANMLTPESLAELMGGPDIAAPSAPPAFGVQPNGTLPGPPNAYSENAPLPPPWYVQPGPPPGPAAGVIAGDPLSALAPAASAPGPAPGAPAGPPLPAEAGQ
jgi:phospholipid/cholesterol/gamma-HCH transport system substrate-binding protein